MDSNVLFSKRQRFKQVWIWIILLGINGLFIYGLVKQVVFKQQFGSKPLSDAGLVIATACSFLPAVLFLCLRLETIIKPDGIYVRFFPFRLNFTHYSWNKLHQLFVRQYNPIGEYGGWGLRGFGKNTALNVSGNKGIQLVTKDGSKILIGTNKADEATRILKQHGHWTD